MLGTLSGTAPGSVFPGGVAFPLNADYLTVDMFLNQNLGVSVDTMGTIDANDNGSSSIVLPSGLIPSGLVGISIDFAHVILHAAMFVQQASNPTTVKFSL